MIPKEELQENFEVDILLRRLIEDPFAYLFQIESDIYSNKISSETVIENQELSNVLFVEERNIISQFSRPIEIVLRPHISISQEFLNKIYQSRNNSLLFSIIEQYGSDLTEKLEEIRKFYRLFIESNTNQHLENEANKLVKRFFGDNYTENQINFIKIKRYLEKLKSFYEKVFPLWKDIEKLTESFSYINETKLLFSNLKPFLSKIQILNFQTQTFIRILENYLKVQDYQYNSNNFSYTANLSYSENIDYTIDGLYNYFTNSRLKESVQKLNRENVISDLDTNTIIIESKLKRFYRNIDFTKIIGSKDWNRTKDYYLEVNKNKYQEDIENFFKSVHVVYDKKTLEESLSVYSSKRTPKKKEELQEIFYLYINKLQELFNENYQQLVNEDFPSIVNPTLFFYHLGANSFYEIIKEDLREKKIGEIFIYREQLLIREFPYNIIKKVLIDWWNDLISLLDLEEVDSYYIYSLQMEVILMEYRKDYEKIKKYFLEKQNISIKNFDMWFLQNYKEIIGIRKFYVYKRFYPTLLIDLNRKKIITS